MSINERRQLAARLEQLRDERNQLIRQRNQIEAALETNKRSLLRDHTAYTQDITRVIR